MSEINYSFIERYQKIIDSDPKSKIFAPLAEAYRKMGMLREAKNLCEKGLVQNPDFSGGHFALSKVLLDLGDLAHAVEHLERVVEYSPENISAQTLLGESCLKLKEPKKALRAFKMVLFVNPDHPKALAAVKKLESLTADEFDEDVFAISKISNVGRSLAEEAEPQVETPMREGTVALPVGSWLERYISLVDAFIARSDIDRAKAALTEAERQLGRHPEIVKRQRFLMRLEDDDREVVEPIAPRERPEEIWRSKRVAKLKTLLNRLREREHVRSERF